MIAANAQYLLSRIGQRGERAKEAAVRRHQMMLGEEASRKDLQAHLNAHKRGRGGPRVGSLRAKNEFIFLFLILYIY